MGRPRGYAEGPLEVRRGHPEDLGQHSPAADDGIGLTFADGCRGVVPFAELPEVGARPGVSALELPNPCQVVPTTSPGERVELPRDFARHCCDRSCRPAAAAVAQQGRRTLGQRVRRLRKSAGLPRRELARSAGSGRVTLVRLENGAQTPRHATLAAVAGSLGQTVPALAAAGELLQ